MAVAWRKGELGIALWLALVLPPVRAWLEVSMTLQMLVQMPLLALAGGWLVAFMPPTWRDGLARWNLHGISGLLLASVTSGIWMVPRMLDASVSQPEMVLAKFVSIPLLLGAPLALSWPRAGFVLRAAVLVEAVATAFRLGWLYLASPTRLCNSYLLDDQQRLGQALLWLGVVACLVMACQLIWGHVRVDEAPG